MPHLPYWLIKRIPKQENVRRTRCLVADDAIHTVCESAKCPNIGECYSKGTMTFMILGNVCTRNCRFCAVEPGNPITVDPEEPQRVAQAAKKLGLNYVVITSVTRDDLPDGGAARFAETIRAIRDSSHVPRPTSHVSRISLRIEVLIPDFQGNPDSLKTVLDSGPDVLNHNIETVPRLYSEVRPDADYQRSLSVLKNAKQLKKHLATKSGLMVGFGETEDEVISVLKDLKGVNCDYVTLGQYLAPSKDHYPVKEYIHPDQFKKYEEIGLGLGFRKVFAGPFVRSSYLAEKMTERSTKWQKKITPLNLEMV